VFENLKTSKKPGRHTHLVI